MRVKFIETWKCKDSGKTVFQFLHLADEKTEHPVRGSYLPRPYTLIIDRTES